MSIAPSAPLHRAMSPRHALPAACLLLMQVMLYIWMAPRGFEFTDESYYFHNFLNWRNFTGTVTFFGAYFEWPFRLMGMSIAGMRILSLVIVLGSAALLMHQLLRFSFHPQTDPGSKLPDTHSRTWYLLAPMASAMLFFSYLSTLRAPSYNLLSLAAIAVMTTCMLRALEAKNAGRALTAAPLIYGLALGACFLSKATSAAFVALAHLVFFVGVNRNWAGKWLLRLLALICMGFALNFIVLTLAYPNWLPALLEGLEITRLRDGTYGMGRMFNRFQRELQIVLLQVGPWLGISGLVLLVARNRIATASRTTLSLVASVVVSAIPYSILSKHQGSTWLVVMAGCALALFAIERLAGRDRPAEDDVRRQLALTALLFYLPIGFSLGTNMPVLAHCAIASLFAFSAVYLRLYRLSQRGMLGGPFLALCLVMLCIPAAAVQWLAFSDVRYTYRQVSALGMQDRKVTVGSRDSRLLVDPSTERSLRDMRAMMKRANMPAGQDLLDLTGDGPGAIYAVGAHPLGTPWMLGGYPGSAAAAERVIQKVDTSRVRQAWLLTSTDNPRRIQGWQQILERRLGPGSHQLAGSIDIVNPMSSQPNKPKTINLQLWRPAGTGAPGLVQNVPDAP